MSNALTTLTNKLARQLGMDDGGNLIETLKATAFRSETPATDAQMVALLVVANQYGLNPWTKELFAFPDKKNGIVPVVGVDGWSRIINDHPMFDGMEFRQSDTMVKMPGAKVEAPEWMEVVFYRKDRSHPTPVREYLDEVYRPPFEGNGRNGPYKIDGPWQSHTKRFLRHKTMIQGARLVFGFSGVFDQDEAERIIEGQAREVEAPQAISTPKPKARPKAEPQAIEHQPDNGVPLDNQIVDNETGELIPAEQQHSAEPKRQPTERASAPSGEGLASPGMLQFIRNKAQEKSIAWERVANEFGIDTLDGISADTANKIIAWVKAQ